MASLGTFTIDVDLGPHTAELVKLHGILEDIRLEADEAYRNSYVLEAQRVLEDIIKTAGKDTETTDA